MSDELDLILSQLASSNLDINSSSKRYEVIVEAERLLVSNCGSDSDDGDGGIDTVVNALLRVASKCYTKHSKIRISNLVLKFIIVQFTNITSKNNDHLKQLWIAYARILTQLNIDLSPFFTRFDTIMKETCIKNQNTKQVITSLHGCVWSLLADTTIHNNTNNQGLWPICLSFVTHLSTTYKDEIPTLAKDAECMDFLIQYTFKQEQIPSHDVLQLSHTFLKHISFIEKDDNDYESIMTSMNSLLSTMGLKLRANPASAFPAIQSILLQLLPSTSASVASSRLIEKAIASNLIEEAKLLQVILKQLSSTKEHLRDMSCNVLLHLSTFHSCFALVVDSIVYLLNNGKSATSSTKVTITGVKLSSADQRIAAFTTLHDIASLVLENKRCTLSSCEDTFSGLFDVLSTLLVRESSSSKEVGVKALLAWMVLYKQMKTSDSDSTNCAGYGKVIDFLSKPILDTKKKSSSSSSSSSSGNEFRSRVGSLFAFANSDEVKDSAVQDIVLDLIKGGKDETPIIDGLQSIVDSSIKKHGNSNIVAQIDGLVATYMLLLHSYRSGNKNSLSQSTRQKVLKAGSSAMNKDSSSSFLYSKAMTDACRTDTVVNTLLCKTINLAYITNKELNGLVCLKEDGVPSAASYALACCIASPNLSGCASSDVLTSIQEILLNANDKSRVDDALTTALLHHVNELTLEKNDAAENSKTRGSGENDDSSSDKDARFVINFKSIHDVSHTLIHTVSDAEHFAQVLLLSHLGTTLKSIGKKQRFGLEKFVTEVLPKLSLKGFSVGEIANSLFVLVTKDQTNKETIFSSTATDLIFKAVLSLVKTLGGIGGNFDEEFNDPDDLDSRTYQLAWTICVKELSLKLAGGLSTALKQVEALTSDDIGLYNSTPGVLYVSKDEVTGSDSNKIVKHKKGTDEEEWERQVKEEIAKKKAAETSGKTSVGATRSLSAEESNKLSLQTTERKRLHHLLDVDFYRCLETIKVLCLSDIEIGNSILPSVGSCVTEAATSKCKAVTSLCSLAQLGYETLCSLATCVYEIDEMYSSDLAKSLCICQNKDVNESYIALPSPCPPAATSITEMDEYGDCLGANSLIFLFPILRSALVGPRSTNGCDSVLRVLNRHTELLDSNESVMTLRKDMASAVLELITHDRSKAFTDPSPTECLQNIYATDKKFTPSEISPLLGTNGSLGSKNCRLACMSVLAHILSKQPRMIKTNPLLENRIWMNCFSQDQDVKNEARKAWKIGHGTQAHESDLSSPSKMFGVALTPLLSHKDIDIAKAAADAYAHAMAKHTEMTRKNLILLFKSYIGSYPTAMEDNGKGLPEPPKAPSVVKPKPSTKTSKLTVGTKKTTKKKRATGTAAISVLTKTKIKSTKKKKSTGPIEITTKKKDRTFDQNMLNAQFQPNSDQEKKTEKDNKEKISVREGVLRVVAASTQCDLKLDTPTLKLLVVFLLAYGLADINQSVRVSATNSLRDVVASGLVKEAIDFVLPLLEGSLKDGQVDKAYLEDLPTEKVFETTLASDNRKEGAVIALGAAAVHLNNETDVKKIDETCDMLISSLSTPSANVQSSVALCLSKLMKKGRMQGRTETLLSQLMNDCLRGKTLACRRGGAYGISAVVKGSGIACLKKYEIVTRLEEACSMGSSQEKEGALFAIELLSNRLGLLFEPYVIVLLPSLLQSFGDTSVHVRTAANSSVGLVMSKLSGHGVKLLMPSVLLALESEDWRTKQASIHMLGTMSHCAPKQLASCLPRLVPKLTEAFSDTHPKVKASAKDALDEISKVVRNPEISEISDTLLQALIDPSNNTLAALESLIETEFLHAIDAASLSLIVPVLHRGLRDRAATTKRYAALIAGNICTMINEPKDFVPYLPMLLPDLKGVLIDPIPDCRSISAKALGSLTRSLGEATFPDLRPWLISTLKADTGTSVERSGAAQGLTELLCAGGARLVESVMTDEILPLISHPSAAYREGVLWVLTFLPSTLGQAFAPLIEPAFPVLISGLSDESEPVRDVAMRAGRVTIRSHGKAHVDKILPTLEEGLNNEDGRMRAASLNLLGDLLGCIGGSKINNDGDSQDDIRQAERAQAQIALVLGSDIRKRVLSSLYLRRSDTTAVVRQSAVQVWKSVVSVTPRTLKEILDSLVGQIVTALASGHPDHTQVAGRCLGDVVSKLGDTVLPEIIPVLRDALYRGDVDTRLGACVGLNEVIMCSSKDQIDKYLRILVKAVQDALCDDLDKVREMAALCFQSLYSVVANKAFDEVVPALLVGMESSSDDHRRSRSINGLTSILKIRSKELLPYLMPRLLKKPVSINHASALGSIFAVTGHSIHSFLSSIIPTFLSELAALENTEVALEEQGREESLRNCLVSLCKYIEERGLNLLVSEIASKCSSDKVAMRKECCSLFKVLVEERKDKNDFYEQIPIILRELLYRLNDESEIVLKETNAALSSLSKHVSAEELVNHIEFIRNLIASIVSESRRRKGGVGDGEFLLPGFNRPKGLEPLLPIYQRGILYGSSAIREVSAAGLGELVSITANKYLSGPFVIKLTGPLLRIVGDRNPPSVKIAIIQTLGLILTKGGPALRAFVPQFQTTFSKALTDPSRQVRVEAIKALGLLMPLSTRVDPLLKDLVSTSLGSDTVSALESAGVIAIQTATLEALSTVLKNGGHKAKLPDTISSALNAGKECLFHNDDGVRIGAAKVVASACELLSLEVTNETALELLQTEIDSLEVKHGLASFCRFILPSKVGPKLRADLIASMKELSITSMNDDSLIVKEMSCTSVAILLGVEPETDSCMEQIESSLLKFMNSKESMEVLKGIAKGLCIVAQLRPQMFSTKLGRSFLEAALDMAMCGNQRVQLAYNDFLWLALNVKDGDDGLLKYTEIAMFEKAKKMKSLYTKVLVRIKDVNIED